MLAFTRAVDDATHDRHPQRLHARISHTPHRHLCPQEIVNLLGKVLKSGAGGTATSRTSGDAGHKNPHPQGLQDFRCHDHFLGTRLTGLGCQRHTNRVANALLQQHGQSGRRSDRSLGTHTRFGQAQVQSIVATACQLAVNRNQILHSADFARQDDLVAVHPHGLRTTRRFNGRCDEGLVHDLTSLPGGTATAVRIHQLGQQFLVETAPVDTNAHSLVPSHGRFDHLAKLLVALVPLAHIARVDPILGQGLGTVGKLGEQAVAVVVEITNQRNTFTHAVELFADVRHRRGRLGGIDRDADKLRTRLGEFLDLNRRSDGIDGIGVGHGLHAHGGVPAHRHHT